MNFTAGNITKLFFFAAAFWVLAGFASLAWNIYDDDRDRKEIAYQTARSFFSQLVIERSWIASHGGVYVPVTDSVQPNQYLKDPLRDLTTVEGVELTMVNPAYMTRQIAEIAAKQKGIHFHITSLAPLRPENKADGWEKTRLESFQKGTKEYGEFMELDGVAGFRYMAPLKMEAGCMGCHLNQGASEGEIAGGISINLPFGFSHSIWALWTSHLTAMFAGMAVILFSGSLLERNRKKLVDAKDKLEKSMHRFTGFVEDMLDYTKLHEPNLQATLFDDWLKELLMDYPFPEGIKLQLALDAAGQEVQLDRERFRRAVINIVANSCQAMEENKSAHQGELLLKVSTRMGNSNLLAIIEDSGPGIDEEVARKIFKPLFTTKSLGSGLGLPIAKKILEAHQGDVEMKNRGTPPGVIITMSIPVNT